MFRQLPYRDWILLFVCSWIIAHANWPDDCPVRTFTCTLDGGQSQQYIIRADDPKVAMIQKQISQRDQVVTPTPLIMARWRRELADFYCRSAAKASTSDGAKLGRDATPYDQSDVAQVTFEASDLATHNGDAAYWSLVRDKADRWIASAEASLAANHIHRRETPMELGPVELSGVGVAGNLSSILIGVILATGFCLWSLTSPAIQLSNEDDQSLRSSFTDFTDRTTAPNQITIPAKWVRINQPASVRLRRFAMAIIVCGAIAIQCRAIMGI